MKFGGWIVMLTTMIIILSLVGVTTTLSPLIESVGINIDNGEVEIADMESSSFWDYLFGSLTGLLVSLGATATVSVGLYLYTKDNGLLVLPFIVWFGGIFVSSFWTIIQTVSELNVWWMTGITTVIFGALSVGYVFSCLDYFLGR